MPIRQITLCSAIFLAILLAAFWMNYYEIEQTKSQQLFVNWKSDVTYSEEQSIDSSSASFYPREYVRILHNDNSLESSPTLP